MVLVILTGVSRGLGKELLRLCLDSDARIVALGRRLPRGLVASEFDFVEIDLSQIDTIDRINIQVSQDISEIVFINNAGIVEPVVPVKKVDLADLQQSHSVNFFAPLLIAKAILNEVSSRSIPLRILNISSGAATKPIPSWASYCSSKAAIRIALDCIAQEESSVVVEHIDPGVMDTGMQRVIRDVADDDFKHKDHFVSLKDDGSLADPKDVARDILSGMGIV